MKSRSINLAAMRAIWADRHAAAVAIREHLVLKGLRRPARDPEEAAWLAERGESIFIEDEEMGRAARDYYQRKYSRP